jgi:hypothetical protein
MAENGSYGRELALRAHELLTRLEPEAKETPGQAPSIGSLYPTFLLSMAVPIIIQPYERFLAKKDNKEARIVVDFDGYSKGSSLAQGLAELKSMKTLSGSPFDNIGWRYAQLKSSVGYKLACGMTAELRTFLKDKRSAEKAMSKSPTMIIEHLRHSMAHGSIVYLGEDWEPSLYGPVQFFLFANLRLNGNVDFLLISIDEFKTFISKWAKWLEDREYDRSP